MARLQYLTMGLSPEPLTGQELLDAVENCTRQGMSKRKVMIACGYATKTADGRIYADRDGFYDALLQAKGVKIGADRPVSRRLSYQVKVQLNGNVVINKSYTRLLGTIPGQALSITLDPARRTLLLQPMASLAAVEEEGDDEGEAAAA